MRRKWTYWSSGLWFSTMAPYAKNGAIYLGPFIQGQIADIIMVYSIISHHLMTGIIIIWTAMVQCYGNMCFPCFGWTWRFVCSTTIWDFFDLFICFGLVCLLLILFIMDFAYFLEAEIFELYFLEFRGLVLTG